MATNAEILPFHHQTILTFQTAAALTNYGGVGGGSSGISTASQLAAAWSMEDHLFQQTELPVLTRSTHHMLRFAPYALPHRPQLQPIPPALYLQHAAAAAAVHAQHHHNLQQRTTSPASPPPTEGYHISNLFPEILELIFNELSVCDLGRAAQVCTAWRDVAYSKSIWKGVEAKLHLKRSSPSLFNCLVKRGIKKVQILSLRRSLKDLVLSVPALNSLNLSGCFNVTDVNLGHAFSVDLPNLKILDLSLCKQITDTSLGRIAQHLKNLQTLDLGIGHLAGLNKATAEGNLELEFLGLQDCNRLSDEALGHIAQGLTSLKSINLSFCLSITDSGLKHLARMPKLEQLNLNSCDNISDIGMAYLTESGSNLNSLDVSFCVKISDQALTHIAQGLYQLRSLSLNHCQITDQGILKIAKALPELEHLNIGQCEGITDKGLQTLAEELLNLKTIDLYGCNKLSSKGIDVIVKLPKLIELNLGLWLKR
uniref:F-box domain-containing protein n=1 Tax=Glossina pallidipes TaxID=7398 RepID=A0A1A9ZKV0_GLOPL